MLTQNRTVLTAVDAGDSSLITEISDLSTEKMAGPVISTIVGCYLSDFNYNRIQFTKQILTWRAWAPIVTFARYVICISSIIWSYVIFSFYSYQNKTKTKHKVDTDNSYKNNTKKLWPETLPFVAIAGDRDSFHDPYGDR